MPEPTVAYLCYFLSIAERVGFEPTVRVTVRTLSRRVPSASSVTSPILFSVIPAKAGIQDFGCQVRTPDSTSKTEIAIRQWADSQ